MAVDGRILRQFVYDGHRTVSDAKNRQDTKDAAAKPSRDTGFDDVPVGDKKHMRINDNRAADIGISHRSEIFDTGY